MQNRIVTFATIFLLAAPAVAILFTQTRKRENS